MKDITEKVDAVMDERQGLRDHTKKMQADQMYMQGDKLRKKLEFVETNGNLVTQKLDQALDDHEEKMADRISFFPFTHGEAVEKHRGYIAEAQRDDLQRIYADKVQTLEENQREKHIEAEENRMRRQARLDRQNDLLNQEN